MFALLMGLLQGALAIWSYTTLTQAARQGARYAMVHGAASPAADDAVRDKVRDAAIGLRRSDIGVVTTWTPDRQMGSQVQVHATYNLPLFLSFGFESSSIILGATASATVTY